MKKEQEQTAAKYTASGKRKFKAKVLSSQEKSMSVFGRTATGVPEVVTQSETLEKLKFKMANKDYHQKAEEEAIKFEPSEEAPEQRKQHFPTPDEEFKSTSEDFRKKK